MLDCTLRDGGYCNSWRFGVGNIKGIIQKLTNANIDIIECGYLKYFAKKDVDRTIYPSLCDVEAVVSEVKSINRNTQYACMINYGEYPIEYLPEYTGGYVNCIRCAFHKKDLQEAVEYCKSVIDKGYEVYVQPMVVSDYSQAEIQDLVNKVNQIKPTGVYIVDSFGVMDGTDLTELVLEINSNLNPEILLGFHSHNNLQLSYSNAKTFIRLAENRDTLLDATVFGMGRGAGNLNIELFAHYLNKEKNANYRIDKMMATYDEHISAFYNKKMWGYSLATYLSATYNCHPNYASYLNEKDTLTINDMENLFSMLDINKKNHFDREYIEDIYQKYLAKNQSMQINDEIIESLLANPVLIIASGQSSYKEKERILKYIAEFSPIVVSINDNYKFYEPDIVFVTNKKRARKLQCGNSKLVITSNIKNILADMVIDYGQFINHYTTVADNAVLMLFSYLISIGKKEVFLAGLDGYSHDIYNNYAREEMILCPQPEILDKKNEEINAYIYSVRESLKVHFITTEKFIGGNDKV